MAPDSHPDAKSKQGARETAAGGCRAASRDRVGQELQTPPCPWSRGLSSLDDSQRRKLAVGVEEMQRSDPRF